MTDTAEHIPGRPPHPDESWRRRWIAVRAGAVVGLAAAAASYGAAAVDRYLDSLTADPCAGESFFCWEGRATDFVAPGMWLALLTMSVLVYAGWEWRRSSTTALPVLERVAVYAALLPFAGISGAWVVGAIRDPYTPPGALDLLWLLFLFGLPLPLGAVISRLPRRPFLGGAAASSIVCLCLVAAIASHDWLAPLLVVPGAVALFCAAAFALRLLQHRARRPAEGTYGSTPVPR